MDNVKHKEEYYAELDMYVQHFEYNGRTYRVGTPCKWVDLTDDLKEFYCDDAAKWIDYLRTDVPFAERVKLTEDFWRPDHDSIH